MLLISDLVKELDSYTPKESVAEIYKAYLFGAQAHDGQKRKTGEPYIYHPIAVAYILAQMRCDAHTIIAAILHDVIEDTGTAKSEISKLFGVEVAHMVDGVSKLGGIHNKSIKQAQADNFRKMMLAMSSDLRVILIKLADRLHNMRTLYGMPTEKRRRISQETLDVYIPLADRLGMYLIKYELENLILQNLYPIRYRILESSLKILRGKLLDTNNKILHKIESKISLLNIDAEIKFREKTLFSIYTKMRRKRLKFSEIRDIYALRVITNSVDDCYRILGVVHNLYKPAIGRFKDYIAIPKINGYQSLHTEFMVGKSSSIEMQIRTKEMENMAESGIASHWRYKSGKDSNQESHFEKATRKWMRQVSELQGNTQDSEEFLESVKIDLFADKVFVFSPKAKIYELPRGSTALDFAYAVHTDLGDHCKHVWINGHMSYMGNELRNGNTVEIFTDDNVSPLPSWLNIVITGKATSHIKASLRKEESKDLAKFGKRLLESSLHKNNMVFSDINDARWEKLLSTFNMKNIDSLFISVGEGTNHPDNIINDLLSQKHSGIASKLKLTLSKIIFKSGKYNKCLDINGLEGRAVSYAECCLPIPGDKIIGLICSEHGIEVHESHCACFKKKFKTSSKVIALKWSPEIFGEFETKIAILVTNKTGALANIASTISAQNSNISEVQTSNNAGEFIVKITIRVKDRHNLAKIIKALRILPVIKSINRIKSR